MKTFLHILYIILLMIIFIFTLPNGLITAIVNNIEIHGDGEDALNRFEFIRLFIKLCLSAVLSLTALYLINQHRRNKRK